MSSEFSFLLFLRFPFPLSLFHVITTVNDRALPDILPLSDFENHPLPSMSHLRAKIHSAFIRGFFSMSINFMMGGAAMY